jgi:DNA-binding NarL/FixJ family response regulator/tetratricopeptide (TPR) repeat protein
VVLSGAPGVGKSRLAAEAAGEASREEGWSTVAVPVSPGTACFPFGALRAALGVTPASVDLAGLSAGLEAAIVASRGDGRVLVVVDDAHLLDEQSAGLLHGLVARGDAALLATVRSGLPVPPALTALWKDRLAERLELEGLPRLELGELVVSTLGGAVADNTIERLWRVSEGNPLYLHEIILASLETGALRQVRDEWRWRGRWAQTSRLQEIVAERLGRLDPDEMAVIEAVSVGGPLSVELLAEIGSATAVARVEARALVTVHATGSQLEVSMTHPVHAEVVRSRMPALLVRSTCRNLVEAVRRLGRDQPSDQVRLARWSLEAGIGVDPVTLRRAADSTLWHVGDAIADRIQQIMPGMAVRSATMSARGPDPDVAVRLARTAWEAGGGVEAGASLAVALAWTGATAEAESVLEQLGGQTKDADHNLQVAIALAEVRFWGERRVADAVNTLAQAYRDAPSWSDPALRSQVLEEWAGIELNVGRPAAAVECAERSASCLGLELARAPSAPPAAAGLAMLGRCGDAVDLIERALPTAVASGQRPLAAAELLLARFGALARMGRLEEARELADGCWRVAVDVDSLDGAAVYGIAAGEALLQEGRPVSAARRFRDAAGLLAERDVLGYLPYALSGLARARATVGDDKGARVALADAERASVLPRFFDPSLYLARSAVHALLGRRDESVVVAKQGAEWCAAAGMVVDEALAVDAWLRLEPSGPASDRLAILATRTDSALVAALARHGDALRRHDPEALLSVSEEFATMAAWLMAAEAAAAAAETLASRHQERPAKAANRRALGWAARCEGARSQQLDRLVAPSMLTSRELEVARQAALGQSNKSIADRLHVSIRTIDAHLYRTYAKLGVRDRTELASVLAADTADRGIDY